MKTQKALFTACLLSALAGGMLHAQTLYTLDMTQDDTGDFNQRVQIGRIGSDNLNALNFVHNTNTYTLQGRYGTGVGLALNQGGTAGVYSGDTEVSLTFNYSGTADIGGNPTDADPSNTIVGLSLRGAKGGDASSTFTTNNYPIYYSLIQENVFSIVKKWGYSDTTEESTVGTYTLQGSEISSSDSYRFVFGAFDQGSNVSIVASLYQENSLVKTLSYLDDGTTGGGPFTSGYIGMIVGESGINTNEYMGIELNSYTVAIPEPSSMALLAGALAGLLVMRRRRH